MWQKILLISAMGIAGTLSRYWLQGWVQELTNARFPWGTLAVNLIGCFLFGIIYTLAQERFLISGETRIILLVGFMGSFTTFSSFAFETAALLENQQWLFACGNLLLQNALGLVAVFLGFFVGRVF